MSWEKTAYWEKWFIDDGLDTAGILKRYLFIDNGIEKTFNSIDYNY